MVPTTSKAGAAKMVPTTSKAGAAIPKCWIAMIVDEAVPEDEAENFCANLQSRGFPRPSAKKMVTSEDLNELSIDWHFEQFADMGTEFGLFFVPNKRPEDKIYKLIKEQATEFNFIAQLVTADTVHLSNHCAGVVSSIVKEFGRKRKH